MSNVFLVEPRTGGTTYRIDFPTLVSLIKGTSITSFAVLRHRHLGGVDRGTTWGGGRAARCATVRMDQR
jgi:hypothetical protein